MTTHMRAAIHPRSRSVLWALGLLASVVPHLACRSHGSTPPEVDVARTAADVEHQPLFVFRNGFWTNLHLRLYHEAIVRRPAPAGAPPSPEGHAWTDAVRYYEETFRDRGPMGLFLDEELIALNRELGAVEGPQEVPQGLDPELTRHLVEAAALVRDDWPEQARMNQAWIDALEPKLESHGAIMQSELVRIFGAPWPDPAPTVDVSCHAGPFSAFTVLDPVQITISSCNPALAGDAGLEMIFHEASHALVGPIQTALEERAARAGVELPPDLWHALLFHTVGVVARRRIGPRYVDYATKNELWARGWSQAHTALSEAWQPYLDGETTLDSALDALVSHGVETEPAK